MKFKKDSEEGKKYLENLKAYILMLDKYILASENIYAEHPEGKNKDDAFYVLMQIIAAHKATATEIYSKANSGESLYSNSFDGLFWGKTDVENSIKKVTKELGEKIENAKDENQSLVFAKELSVVENAGIDIAKQYETIFVAPELEAEPWEKPNSKQAKEEKSAKKSNPYKAEYMAEFKRLCKELAGTDPWYSKGSPSYRNLRNSLDGFNNRLASCDEKNFDAEFKNVISDFNKLAKDYRNNHANIKLDSRQMKRLKIMNRIYALGEKYKNPDINPSKDYVSKIAEKFIHAKAIEALKKNPLDAEAKGTLLYPLKSYDNAKELASQEIFRNVLPPTDKDLAQRVKTKGEALMKPLERHMTEEKATLDFLSGLKEESKKQVAIQKLNSKKIEKNSKGSSQDLTEEEILFFEEQFKQMESSSQNEDDFDLQLALNEINKMENGGYQYQYEQDLSSKLTPKQKREQRMNAAPDNGRGTSDEVLSDPEMEELEKQMLAGSEYNYSGAIPNNIRLSSSVTELTNFKATHPNLSEADKKYIDSHIATEKFYKKLEENKITAKPKDPVVRDDGTVILEHIHLDTKQTSNMGCYSCSEMLLLQSRGLFLDQRQIRNYRMESSSYFADNEERERTSGDVMGNIVNIGGIATRCLTNTAVHERTYSQIVTASPQTKNKVAADIRKTVQNALLIHKSPVSVLMDGHYVTVIGYNPNTDTLTYKNSLKDRDHIPGTPVDPDKEHTMPLRKLLSAHRLAIGHLMTINPENPMEYLGENKEHEFVNGQYMENNQSTTGIAPGNDNPDGKLIWHYNMLGDGNRDMCSIQSVTKVPKKLELTREMEQRIGNRFKIVPLKDSPEKQQLMRDIEAAENKLFKKDDKISVAGNLQLGNTRWSNISFKCNGKDVKNESVMTYLYLQKLKAKIDVLTPWQVQNAFRKDRLENAKGYFANNDAFQTLREANGKTVSISDMANRFIAEHLPEQPRLNPPQPQINNSQLQLGGL